MMTVEQIEQRLTIVREEQHELKNAVGAILLFAFLISVILLLKISRQPKTPKP